MTTPTDSPPNDGLKPLPITTSLPKRRGWAEAFQRQPTLIDDALPHFNNRFDQDEWTWPS